VPFPAFLTAQLAAAMVGKARADLVFTLTGGPGVAGVVLPAAGVQRGSEELPGQQRRVPEGDTSRSPAHRGFAGISAGANVKGVQLMLGHKSAALALDTYADLFPDDLEAVAEALNAAALAAAAYPLRTESSRGATRKHG